MRKIKGYKQLSLEERELLFAWREQKQPFREIARKLNRSHTTISREIRRNKRVTGSYIPCSAHSYAQDRLHTQRSQARLKSPVIYEYVLEHLKLKWSPETIAGRLPLDHPGLSIHHESIYRYIYWDNGKGLHLWKYLTHARKKRMKKGGRRVKHSKTIPDGVSIDNRPQEVKERSVIGHWETDNIVGKVTDTSALSTTVERVARYTILTKLVDKSAEEKYVALTKRLFPLPKEIRRSVTTDNGVENAQHKKISETLDLLMFFCHAYASWEKGGVENMNGRIRRYIPKGTSIDELTEEQIAEVEYQLNNTPRKCLGYKTPEEVMLQPMWGHTAYGSLSQKVRDYLAGRSLVDTRQSTG